MTPTMEDLMDEGYTWEEAEDLLSRMAEDYADAERDRQMEQRYFVTDNERSNGPRR